MTCSNSIASSPDTPPDTFSSYLFSIVQCYFCVRISGALLLKKPRKPTYSPAFVFLAARLLWLSSFGPSVLRSTVLGDRVVQLHTQRASPCTRYVKESRFMRKSCVSSRSKLMIMPLYCVFGEPKTSPTNMASLGSLSKKFCNIIVPL